jgi:hypothetical protein
MAGNGVEVRDVAMKLTGGPSPETAILVACRGSNPDNVVGGLDLHVTSSVFTSFLSQ